MPAASGAAAAARLPVELIRAKRDGEALTAAELRAFIAGVTDGSIPDYQVAAMLMAIYFRGLTDDELGTWADAMVRSGDVLDLAAIPRPKVDKHSTGGVGDKISIPLAPAVAACGVAVPMVSGRGLGHTGGTLDKLESIPGFRVDLDVERFAAQVGQLGVCLIGQTERVAPADRRLYALRDVTGTIESIPLIASSIMSKKLAEGIDALVLDCKVGAGAFMKDATRARALCAAIRAIGHAAGKAVTCVLTDMDAPIGHAVGNALEIAESIDVLSGGGPADTRELTVVLGGEMLLLAGVARTADEGQARIAHALDDGSALAVFRRVVAAQGGDPAVCDRPGEVLPRARHQWPVRAPRAGAIAAIDAEDVGMAALVLGAGRRTKDDVIDPAAGVVLACGLGDRVTAGQPLATLHANLAEDDPRVAAATARFLGAIHLADDAPPPRATRVLETLR
ncbi:MAG: thymidine phosphorylase [Kofleriaceae bacterium]|nr:thymidine phosphorylase [Kofleriaceae bacterium]MCL4227973.1 thymidine phosphorylase [Myxococcales bacterium]